MASHTDIAKRWADRLAGRTEKEAYCARGNLYESNERLWSYGSHFELGRLVRPRRGANFFLLNGDSYSSTTARHQAETRAAVSQTEIPYAIIPHSALKAAGIILDSIEPVEVRADGYERIPRTCSIPGLQELTAKVLGGNFGWSEGRASSSSASLSHDGHKYTVTVYKSGWDYSTVQWTEYDPPHVNLWRDGTAQLTSLGGDVYSYEDTRHWLGACLFSAKVSGQSGRSYFLSAFDENERRPLYFLCELPKGSRPTTVDDALESLKPSEVVTAQAAGIEVARQGDVFAIPHYGIDGAYPIPFRYPAKREYVLDTNHTASEVVTLADGRVFGRGVLRHEPRFRDPDHARVILGDSWHLLVRNTVPQSRGRNTSSALVNQSGNARAWTLGGQVD